MKKVSIILCIIFTFGILVKAQENDYFTDEEIEVLRLINNHRTSIGCKPLQMDKVVYKYAKQHSKNMAEGKVKFSHIGFDERIKKINKYYKKVWASAENVAYGQPTPQDVVDSWLNSAGHKRNIEGNYNYCGLAIFRDENGVSYYTHIFIKRE